MMKKILFCLAVCGSVLPSSFSQDGWPAIPGMDEGEFAIYNQQTFFYLMGAASVSYALAEFVLQNEENLNFYQGRLGVAGAKEGYTIFQESFGIEKRAASWFAFALEFNNQQWTSPAGNGAGLGLNTHYRWYAFGKKKLSPFVEMGAGLFQGFRPLPADGTGFTFHLTANLGLEYTRDNQDRIRLTYGHLHQSNNGLFDRNPGLIGNGFSVTYSRFWKASKW